MEYQGTIHPDTLLLERLAAADPEEGLIWAELLGLLGRERLQATLRQLMAKQYVRTEFLPRFKRPPLKHYIITAEGRAEFVSLTSKNRKDT